MRVERILRQVWGACAGRIHAVRLAAVVAAVEGLAWGARLSVTGIGRCLRGSTAAKHSIKRIDRLLSNGQLWFERRTLFSAMAHHLLAGVARPVIAIDWTALVGGAHALVAAVPLFGRALPIYLQVHPESRLGNAAVEDRFLRALRDVLPAGCRPIILSDAGYRTPFFRSVLAQGWDFVGRIRGVMTMRAAGQELITSKRALYELATSRPAALGAYTLCPRSCANPTGKQLEARLVLVRGSRKPCRGSRSKLTSNAKRKAAQASKEPWLLATSLTMSAKRIVRLYATRMQIEETFRDAKNPRWGWSFRHARCGHTERMATLLLIASLTSLAMTLLGHAIEMRGQHRAFQANTVKTRTLSLVVLATQYLQRDRPPPLHASEIVGHIAGVRVALIELTT